jgi:hypothetical protein
MKAAWMALAVMVACGSWAQAPKSSGTARKSPPAKSHTADTAHAGQYPTNDAPLPVTVLPSPEDATGAANREKKADEFNRNYLDTQVRLAKASEKQANAAIAAAVIVFFDFFIAAFALWFLRGTYLATRAQLRPRFFVRELLQLSIDGSALKIQCAIGNAGETEGTIIESHVDVQFATFDEWRPRRPNGTGSPNMIVSGPNCIAAGAQVYWDIDCSMDEATLLSLANAEEEAQRKSKTFGVVISGFGPPPPALHLQGFIVYKDEKGVKRRTAFLRYLNENTLRFSRRDDPDYEYAD